MESITKSLVDSFLTTAIASNRKIATDEKIAGRALLGLTPRNFGDLADELERIRDDWRLRRRNDELS